MEISNFKMNFHRKQESDILSFVQNFSFGRRQKIAGAIFSSIISNYKGGFEITEWKKTRIILFQK